MDMDARLVSPESADSHTEIEILTIFTQTHRVPKLVSQRVKGEQKDPTSRVVALKSKAKATTILFESFSKLIMSP